MHPPPHLQITQITCVCLLPLLAWAGLPQSSAHVTLEAPTHTPADGGLLLLQRRALRQQLTLPQTQILPQQGLPQITASGGPLDPSGGGFAGGKGVGDSQVGKVWAGAIR